MKKSSHNSSQGCRLQYPYIYLTIFILILISFVWIRLITHQKQKLIRSLPKSTQVSDVLDSQTILIKNREKIGLLGIISHRGDKDDLAQNYLLDLVANKIITLEYNGYQKDKAGRLLAYIWIKCEDEIRLYCRGDYALVNEIMIKKGYVQAIKGSDSKMLKYKDYLFSHTSRPEKYRI